MLPHEPSCMLSHGITSSTSVLDLSHLVVHSPSYKDQRILTNPVTGRGYQDSTRTCECQISWEAFVPLQVNNTVNEL